MKQTKAYYLSTDIIESIKQLGKKDNRSESNMAEILLKSAISKKLKSA